MPHLISQLPMAIICLHYSTAIQGFKMRFHWQLRLKTQDGWEHVLIQQDLNLYAVLCETMLMAYLQIVSISVYRVLTPIIYLHKQEKHLCTVKLPCMNTKIYWENYPCAALLLRDQGSIFTPFTAFCSFHKLICIFRENGSYKLFGND